LTNIVGAKILEVNIPFSYYVIVDRFSLSGTVENRLTLNWDIPGSASFDIPAGNYTGTSLATVIGALLNAVIVASANFIAPKSGSCTYDTSTGKFIMTVNHSAPFAPAGLYFSCSSELAVTLGFTLDILNFIYWTPQTSAAQYTLTSTKIAMVTGPNNLYVNSRILGNVCKAYLPEGALSVGETNPQMAMVPVNVNPGGIIWWQDPAPQEVFDTRNLFSLQALDLYITAGTDRRPLLFNGLGFQVKLMLFIKNNEQSTSQAGTLGQNRSVLSIRNF